MVLVIGEILHDIFPGYRRAGGAPFNFACHLNSLGIETLFVSRVGDDEDGRALLEFARERGLGTGLIQVDGLRETGRSIISLDASGNGSFNIKPDAAYDYIEITAPVRKALERADMIYFGSLAQRTTGGFRAVQSLLTGRKSGTRAFFDINLRPGCFDGRTIRESLLRCDILKLNHEELDYVANMLSPQGDGAASADALMSGYGISIISLTSGAAGSRLYAGGKNYTVQPAAGIHVVDTVGAGDGYAAMLCAGLLAGWEPEKIIGAASCFSSAICGIEGAIPADDDFDPPYRDFFR